MTIYLLRALSYKYFNYICMLFSLHLNLEFINYLNISKKDCMSCSINYGYKCILYKLLFNLCTINKNNFE